MAGAGRPAAQRACDADLAGGQRDRLAPSGGWKLARFAMRVSGVADGVWLVPPLAGAGAVRASAMRPCPPAAEGAGRKAEPSRAIIDTQTVKCIPVRGPRGYDAAKKVLGRKRVALVDADGNWLAVAVVPASVQDRDALPALDAGKAEWPSLCEAIFDGAFTAERCREWSNRHGMRHRVVERDPAQKGFVVLAGRWVVERSFGWLVHWGGLLRDRAGRLDVAGARLAFAAALSGVEALLNPMPVHAAAS